MIERLCLAALLGGIVGWEREQRNKQAGFKTHLLVSVGSALIMLTSIYGFGDLLNHPNARFDPARLAAQVVSGIGFLGAGAILRHSNMVVSGLTTAATLWVVAAIGLSVGAGFYIPAIVTTIIVLFSTIFLGEIESKFLRKRLKDLQIVVCDQPGKLSEISSLLSSVQMKIRQASVEKFADGEQYVIIYFQVQVPSRQNVHDLMEKLYLIEGVKKVQWI